MMSKIHLVPENVVYFSAYDHKRRRPIDIYEILKGRKKLSKIIINFFICTSKPIMLFSLSLFYWGFTPLSTLFQLYHRDS